MPQMNEKMAHIEWNKGAGKLKGREIWWCGNIRGAKIKDAKLKEGKFQWE